MKKIYNIKYIAVLVALFLLLTSVFTEIASGKDSTEAPFINTVITSKSSGGVPVGTIISWPVSQNPEDMDNWLECNGQSISRSVYPELFAVVGGQTPDLRGLFLRGHGGNSSALGIQQSDAIRNITGTLANVQESQQRSAYATGAFRLTTSMTQGHPYYTVNGSYGCDFDASRVVPTANENRPVNQAVRYLIRARP